MKRGWISILVSVVLAIGLGLLSMPRPAMAAACVWTGNTSTDWAATGNWSSCQGDGTASPAADDTVTINSGGNQPTIGADVTIAGLTLNTGSTVTINSGVKLTVNGNLSMGADGGATTTISNAGTFETTGTGTATFTRSNETSTANFSLTGAGSWTFASTFTQTTYTKITLGSGNYNLKGDLSRAGTFDPGTSTINFNSGSTQSMSGTVQHHFYNLVITNNTAFNHTSGSVSVNIRNNFTVDAGSTFYQSGSAAGREVVFVHNESYPTSNLSGGGTFTFARLTIEANKTVNAGSTSITITGNWTNDGTFTAGTGTVTFNGTSAQTIGGATATTFNNLTINNSAGVTLSTDTTVNGTLALTSGDLTTGSNTLTMGSSATSSGSSDVVGNVTRSGFSAGSTYNFGNPNVSLNFASGGTLPSSVTVNLAKSAPSGFSNAVQRTYTISQSGGSGFSATLRLHYLDSELGSNTEADLTLWRKDGTTWSNQGRTDNVDTTDNWVELSEVTTLSDWTLASSAPTAVTLSSFTARSPTSQATFFPWQRLALAVGLVLGGGAVVGRLRRR